MKRIVLAGVMLLAAAPLAAQRAELPQAWYPPPRAYVAANVQIAQASGIFSNYVQAGFGFGGHFLYRPDPEGVFGIRAGGMFVIYGSQTHRYPLVPGILVDVTTQNQIAGFTFGPQLTFGRGAVQAYGHGGIGFSYFATTSSVEGSGNVGQPFASTTNYDDFTFAGEGGGGVWVFLSRRRTPVALDLGVRYLQNGRVTYVTESGVTVDQTTNQLVVDPIDSEANLIVYHVGVVIGLRARRYARGRDDD